MGLSIESNAKKDKKKNQFIYSHLIKINIGCDENENKKEFLYININSKTFFPAHSNDNDKRFLLALTMEIYKEFILLCGLLEKGPISSIITPHSYGGKLRNIDILPNTLKYFFYFDNQL